MACSPPLFLPLPMRGSLGAQVDGTAVSQEMTCSTLKVHVHLTLAQSCDWCCSSRMFPSHSSSQGWGFLFFFSLWQQGLGIAEALCCSYASQQLR